MYKVTGRGYSDTIHYQRYYCYSYYFVDVVNAHFFEARMCMRIVGDDFFPSLTFQVSPFSLEQYMEIHPPSWGF